MYFIAILRNFYLINLQAFMTTKSNSRTIISLDNRKNYMNSIKITANNGSALHNYFIQFELTFRSNGKSTFKLINGRDERATEVMKKSKQLQITEVDTSNFRDLQKTISIQKNNKETIWKIILTEIEALLFLNQC